MAATDDAVVLDRYRLYHPLKVLDSVDVWVSEDFCEGGKFAVKRLRLKNEAVTSRFRREVNAQGLVADSSRFVVPVEAFSFVPREAIIVTPYYPLGDAGHYAEHRVNQGDPLQPNELMPWVASETSGLESTHVLRLLHRDVKPGNLLRHGPEVRLSDYGIAKHEYDPTVTSAGERLGTLGFAPPEVWLGQELSPKSDVYSLAATHYHHLTGRAPTEMDQGGFIEHIERHVFNDPEPPSNWRQGVPARVDEVVLSGLRNTRDARPELMAYAEELLDALREWAEALGLQVPEVRIEVCDLAHARVTQRPKEPGWQPGRAGDAETGAGHTERDTHHLWMPPEPPADAPSSEAVTFGLRVDDAGIDFTPVDLPSEQTRDGDRAATGSGAYTTASPDETGEQPVAPAEADDANGREPPPPQETESASTRHRAADDAAGDPAAEPGPADHAPPRHVPTPGEADSAEPPPNSGAEPAFAAARERVHRSVTGSVIDAATWAREHWPAARRSVGKFLRLAVMALRLAVLAAVFAATLLICGLMFLSGTAALRALEFGRDHGLPLLKRLLAALRERLGRASHAANRRGVPALGRVLGGLGSLLDFIAAAAIAGGQTLKVVSARAWSTAAAAPQRARAARRSVSDGLARRRARWNAPSARARRRTYRRRALVLAVLVAGAVVVLRKENQQSLSEFFENASDDVASSAVRIYDDVAADARYSWFSLREKSGEFQLLALGAALAALLVPRRLRWCKLRRTISIVGLTSVLIFVPPYPNPTDQARLIESDYVAPRPPPATRQTTAPAPTSPREPTAEEKAAEAKRARFARAARHNSAVARALRAELRYRRSLYRQWSSLGYDVSYWRGVDERAFRQQIIRLRRNDGSRSGEHLRRRIKEWLVGKRRQSRGWGW